MGAGSQGTQNTLKLQGPLQAPSLPKPSPWNSLGPAGNM